MGDTHKANLQTSTSKTFIKHKISIASMTHNATSQKQSLSTLSRRFKMAFDKGLDKLFPECSSGMEHPMGMQPFMSTSCHITMVGAGSHPKHSVIENKKSYWRSFPEMSSSSNTLDSLDSRESLAK